MRPLHRRNGRNGHGHFSLPRRMCEDLVYACITGPNRRTWTISFVGRVGNSTIVHRPARDVGLQRRRRRRRRRREWTWVALYVESTTTKPSAVRVAAANACPGLDWGAGHCGLGGGGGNCGSVSPEERCAPHNQQEDETAHRGN